MLSINRLCWLLVISAAFTHPSVAVSPPEDKVLTAVDIETTGLSPAHNRVIEVSAIRFSGTNVLGRFTWLIDPKAPIPANAARLHGITDAMVRGQPDFQQVADAISAVLSNSTVIAHNARFDWKFLQAEYKRAGKNAPQVEVVDSLALSRMAFPALESYQLKKLLKSLDIKADSTHRAEADAFAVVMLTNHCLTALPQAERANAMRQCMITEDKLASDHEIP